MVSFGRALCYVLVGWLAFLLKLLYDFGEFQFIYPKNVRSCQRIEGFHGCEDFASLSDDRMIMSCDDRSWLGYQWVNSKNLSTRIQEQKSQGSLYLLDSSSSYEKPQLLTKTNYNYKDFHPLGIGTLEDNTGKWLFVNDNHPNGEQVDIFQIPTKENGLKENELSLFAVVKSKAFENYQMLNDLVVVPNSNGAFYVTIWLVHEPGSFQNWMDVYFLKPVSYVLFCEPPYHNFLSTKPKNLEVEFNCRKVVEKLKMANGITMSSNNKYLYVVETILRTMDIFVRNEETNELSLVEKVKTNSSCDNIEYNREDKYVYLGCHPKSLTFQLHASFPHKIVAPSRIVRFKEGDNRTNNRMQVVLESVGEIIGGSSTAIKSKKKDLIVGSVHDDAYLVCHNFKY